MIAGCYYLILINFIQLEMDIWRTNSDYPGQGSHKNSKKQFHDFSTISHDQQCNFHDYLIHGLQPSLLAASSPR